MKAKVAAAAFALVLLVSCTSAAEQSARQTEIDYGKSVAGRNAKLRELANAEFRRFYGPIAGSFNEAFEMQTRYATAASPALENWRRRIGLSSAKALVTAP
jgi:hypothetical protein